MKNSVKKKYKKATDKDIKNFKKLSKKGLNHMQIAQKTGFSYWTVMYHLNPSYQKYVIDSRRKSYNKKKVK